MSRAFCVLSVLVVAACAVTNKVQVRPVWDPGQPVFHIAGETGGNPREVYGLTVTPCGSDSSMWTIALTGDNASAHDVTYGQLPPGYSAVAPAKPLAAGCYDLFVTDATPTVFHIRPDGEVVEFVRTDSIKTVQRLAREKARRDSITAVALRDSVAKVRRDSAAAAKARQDSAKAKAPPDSARKPRR